MDAMASCQPNISPAGRRRRLRVGYPMVAVTLGLFVTLASMHARWYWGALMFLPAVATATTLLQVRRNTCVLRAQEGTVEHEDFSTTPASADDARASREVARTIRRDAALIGLAATAIAIAVSFV
jgi:hypothetical protein